MQLPRRSDQPTNTKTAAELLLLEMERTATLEAVLRELVAAVDEQADIDPTARLYQAMKDARSWINAGTVHSHRR